MDVKVLDRHAASEEATVARGVRYAVAHGARIINLSLAAPLPSPALRSALTDAQDAGVLVVAAAGNWGQDLRRAPEYPASDGAPNVISVAATDRAGALDPTANFGSAVDLAPAWDRHRLHGPRRWLRAAHRHGDRRRVGRRGARRLAAPRLALAAAALPRSARHMSLPIDAGAAVAWTPPAGFDTRVSHAKRAAPTHH